MCNAWNHPVGCRCGWGGKGHAGRTYGATSSARSFGAVANLRYRELFDAYTTPKARCPVCGAKVFFYQSEAGGRVYFDELGPPWPKHPCTDSSGHKSTKALSTTVTSEWQPLLIESFAKVAKYAHCYAVSAHTVSGHIAFYVRSSRVKLRAPFYIRRQPNGAIELSSVQPYMYGFTTVQLPAWRSLLEASRAPIDAWSREEDVELQIFEILNQANTSSSGA